MNKIRKGDEVVVTAGRDKGRRGTVVQVLDDRLVVEGINMVKRHTKPNPQRNVPGGIVEKEASIDRSNVMLWNPVTKKGDRVGINVLEPDANGKVRRVRFFKSNKENVDA